MICPTDYGSQGFWGSILPELRPMQSLGTPSNSEGASLASCPLPLLHLGMFGFLLLRAGPSDLVGADAPLVCWIPHWTGGGLSSLVGGPFSLMVSLWCCAGLIWLNWDDIACWALQPRILFYLYLCFFSEMEVFEVQIEAPLRCKALCTRLKLPTSSLVPYCSPTYALNKFHKKNNIIIWKYFISFL